MRARLGDIATYVNGYAFKPSDWSATGRPIIRIQDLTGNSYQANRFNGVIDKKYNVFDGDVLISWSASLGVYIWHGEDAVLNQHIFKVVFDKAEVNKSFFIYQVENILQNAGKETHGATMKHLTKPVFDALPFYLPDMEEQTEIARKLDTVSNIISIRKQQLAKLDELVKSRFIEMFGDPVSNPFELPIVMLSEISDIVSGITKGRKTSGAELFEVPYMAVSNVKAGYIDWSTVKTIEATEEEIDQYRLQSFDVLMTEGGDPDKLGRGAIINDPPKNCIHQNHIFRVRVNRSCLLPQYLEEYLQHRKAKQYFLGCAKQTTGIASINMKQLRAMPVLLPEIALQEQFATFVQTTDKSKLTIQESLNGLETLKKSLMQEYFG